jgi:cyclophilin family peptidyl-prolyl cis-trans isomerase
MTLIDKFTRPLAIIAILAGGMWLAANEATSAETDTVEIKNPEDTLVIELKDGKVYIELLPDVAPKHVAQVKALARQGFYDNVVFHRVIDGFMAQTGDGQYGDTEDGYNLRRAGTGGSSLPDIPAEFSSLPFDKGVMGMARSQSPNSANSQFFIMLDEGHFLNNQYTVLGRVIGGMQHVDAIKLGDRANNGAVTDPDKMLSVKVAADM